jgi:hypothetical protein
MTGQRCQAPFDEGARGLQLSALACEAGLKEHEFWPRQCRIRDKPVEKLAHMRRKLKLRWCSNKPARRPC